MNWDPRNWATSVGIRSATLSSQATCWICNWNELKQWDGHRQLLSSNLSLHCSLDHWVRNTNLDWKLNNTITNISWFDLIYESMSSILASITNIENVGMNAQSSDLSVFFVWTLYCAACACNAPGMISVCSLQVLNVSANSEVNFDGIGELDSTALVNRFALKIRTNTIVAITDRRLFMTATAFSRTCIEKLKHSLFRLVH